MGRAALAFAAGLGKGYIDEGQYQDKKDLLEREMALREKEAGLRIRHMEGQLGDAEQERQQRNAIDKTITDVMSAGAVENNAAAVTYEGADGVKKTAYQPDIETAKAAAQQDALERGVAPSAYEVQPASSIRSIDGSRKLFTGLSAASDAAKFYSENPVSGYSKYIALRDKLSSMPGGRKEADEMLRRAKEMRSEGVMDTLSALDAGDVSGAIRAWDSAGLVRFPAGAKIIPDANGIDPLTGASKTMYSVVGADGKTIVPNIHAAAYGHLLGAKDRATIESQTTAKKNATEALLEKIEAQRERDRMRDQTMQLRLGGAVGAGGSGARSNKAEQPSSSLAMFDDVQKNAQTGTNLPMDALAQGREHAARIDAQNPGLNPTVGANVAIGLASGKLKEEPAIDPATGTLYKQVNAGNGMWIKTRPTGIKPAQVVGDGAAQFGMKPEDAAALTQTFYARLGEDGPRYLAVVRDKKMGPELRRALEDSQVNKAIGKLMDDPRFKAQTPEIQQKLIEQGKQAELTRIGNTLDWLGWHGTKIKMPETKKGPGAPALGTSQDRLQAAYSEWMSAQSDRRSAEPSWMSQQTPTSGARLESAKRAEAEAEARYSALLKNAR